MTGRPAFAKNRGGWMGSFFPQIALLQEVLSVYITRGSHTFLFVNGGLKRTASHEPACQHRAPQPAQQQARRPPNTPTAPTTSHSRSSSSMGRTPKSGAAAPATKAPSASGARSNKSGGGGGPSSPTPGEVRSMLAPAAAALAAAASDPLASGAEPEAALKNLARKRGDVAEQLRDVERQVRRCTVVFRVVSCDVGSQQQHHGCQQQHHHRQQQPPPVHRQPTRPTTPFPPPHQSHPPDLRPRNEVPGGLQPRRQRAQRCVGGGARTHAGLRSGLLVQGPSSSSPHLSTPPPLSPRITQNILTPNQATRASCRSRCSSTRSRPAT
jgi:hypothetical protein